MKIEFHPRVLSEIDAIMRYYEDVAGFTLADDFYSEFRSAVLEVSENPHLVSERLGAYRRVNLRQFPYNFLFRELDDRIRILVVRHHARHPGFGARRK